MLACPCTGKPRSHENFNSLWCTAYGRCCQCIKQGVERGGILVHWYALCGGGGRVCEVNSPLLEILPIRAWQVIGYREWYDSHVRRSQCWWV